MQYAVCSMQCAVKLDVCWNEAESVVNHKELGQDDTASAGQVALHYTAQIQQMSPQSIVWINIRAKLLLS